MKVVWPVLTLSLLFALPGCSSKSKHAPDPMASRTSQVDDLCKLALQKLERDRLPMQKYLHPINQGVGLVLGYKKELDLTDDQIEDLLNIRVAAERDINLLEAKIKTLGAEITNEMHVEGIADADIEDEILRIGEIQSKIENRRFKALSKAVDELTSDQQKRLNELLLQELE